MTSSPDLIHELRASRPSAPHELRTRIRAIAAEPERTARARRAGWRFPVRRGMLVAVPAAAALALATAGVLGLARSDAPVSQSVAERDTTDSFETYTGTPSGTNELGQAQNAPSAPGRLAPPAGAADAATADRAQKVSATLTVEVKDSDAVSRAAQSALDLTRTLGGFVVTSSVATGDEGSASITVRVPVDKVQDAIAGLSGLGRIVSQQVNVDDLQEGINGSERRIRSLDAQIALITARLESEALDAETEARLEARRKSLRGIRLAFRRSLATMRAEARMSTIQLTVVTPGASGAVAPSSRIDRTIDEALNVLAWEGVVALGILIVLAPFALVVGAVWLGHRLYRRHEEERLLAA
jgi:Domain of unknown function (DUF4349)